MCFSPQYGFWHRPRFLIVRYDRDLGLLYHDTAGLPSLRCGLLAAKKRAGTIGKKVTGQ